MMAKFQRFGGAMFTPVVFFVFSGIVVGLTAVFTNPAIVGGLAAPGTAWISIWKIIDAGGWTVFNNMEVLFVIGLPLGLANKAKERASLEAFVIYMTFNNFVNQILQMFGKNFGVNINSTSETSGLKVIAGVKTLDTGVIGAILIAGIVVWLHNRYFGTRLPDWLGVFQGSAFVAMIGFFLMIPIAGLFVWIWPVFQHGILQMQYFMVKSGNFGVFTYIFLEKALLPLGLHHFIYAPFQYGPAVIEGGTTLYWVKHISQFAATSTPLIKLFPEGGYALQGLSNIFGIPGIALAFYSTAIPKNRKKLLALIIPGVLTAALAGITEPFDYTFLFIAPALFFVHAFLAASLATTMYAFGVTGDMSAGLIDITAKNYIPMWANHWQTYVIQWVIGLIFIGIYFVVFKFLILKFDFKTPGRSDDEMVNMFTKDDYKKKKSKGQDNGQKSNNPFRSAAGAYINLLGGPDNIASVNNCFTRLRLTINKPELLATDNQFMSVGAKGVVRNKDAVQVIIGPDVTNVREEVDDLIDNGGWEEFNNQTSDPTSVEEKEQETKFITNESQLFAPVDGKFTEIEKLDDGVFSQGLIGSGYAVNPTSEDIYASVEGKIESIFPTKHAIGIKSLSGAEILIHLGLDTVEMEGKPFDILVSEGDEVSEDTKIGRMDIEQIKRAGKNPVVITVLTNGEKYSIDRFSKVDGTNVNHGDSIVLTHRL
ncbi:alpha-glucoside-specific PTS transporter subunit IIBC [Companilactobacillus halodurans]|uniref:Protein-N(Pi)-phosphohistidine--sugar phosphotransferase n=1 Tax=Companilactobacillus halodurans TaxID=2584183 RepID=A0A5P0ZXC9_9LACO|nr:protein-N(pi)-phosphohistidine--sugar phosphotransferase [Companilactobacillus halodurans]MQS97753.1 protein-N(pi)-phosphohistidine--sugar phosphotransferase [Companilactobacillus halodurans]